MTGGWNPWHGCHKQSEGCANCYVYRIDAAHDRDPSTPHRTGAFGLPTRKTRTGEWRVPDGTVLYTCFSSDFFLEEADAWRPEDMTGVNTPKDLAAVEAALTARG